MKTAHQSKRVRYASGRKLVLPDLETAQRKSRSEVYPLMQNRFTTFDAWLTRCGLSQTSCLPACRSGLYTDFT